RLNTSPTSCDRRSMSSMISASFRVNRTFTGVDGTPWSPFRLVGKYGLVAARRKRGPTLRAAQRTIRDAADRSTCVSNLDAQRRTRRSKGPPWLLVSTRPLMLRRSHVGCLFRPQPEVIPLAPPGCPKSLEHHGLIFEAQQGTPGCPRERMRQHP